MLKRATLASSTLGALGFGPIGAYAGAEKDKKTKAAIGSAVGATVGGITAAALTRPSFNPRSNVAGMTLITAGTSLGSAAGAAIAHGESNSSDDPGAVPLKTMSKSMGVRVAAPVAFIAGNKIIYSNPEYFRHAGVSPEVREFGKYVKEKHNLETTLHGSGQAAGSYYHPITNKVHTADNLAIAAHEYGHARSFERTRKMFGKNTSIAKAIFERPLKDIFRPAAAEVDPKFVLINKALGPLKHVTPTTLPAIALASESVAKAVRGDDKDSTRYQVGEFIRKHPSVPVFAAGSAQLLEEGKASVHGVTDMYGFLRSKGNTVGHSFGRSVGGGLKTLLPAFMTYAGIGLGAPLAFGMLADGMRKAKDNPNAMKKD